MNILIADAGSTKISWAIISDKNPAKTFVTEGLNALMASKETIGQRLAEADRQFSQAGCPTVFDSVYYYGAGCATPQICEVMHSHIQSKWNTDKIEVTTDLLGAARSLHGKSRGIAGILGTGSNSCLYDGSGIEHNVPSLGYILGDEGSGAALGKRLVSDAFKGRLPELVKQRFLEKYNLSMGDILDKVYNQPAPNKFLASLVPFLHENVWNPYIYSLIHKEFCNYLKRNIVLYEGARSLPIAFTGSIAYHFSDILTAAARSSGLGIAKIEASPIDGLIKHHSTELMS